MRTLVFAVLVACGGGRHVAPASRTWCSRSGERQLGALQPAPATPATTAADCDRLFAHVIQLDEHTGKLAEADRDHVRTQLTSELGDECMTKPRAIVLCGIEAPTSDAIAECDQRTPSSSTSNSSVAPGGITPAAPRSP